MGSVIIIILIPLTLRMAACSHAEIGCQRYPIPMLQFEPVIVYPFNAEGLVMNMHHDNDR